MNTLSAFLPIAQAAGGSGQMMTTFVTFGLVILIFYFLIIRPQNKRQKDAKKMLETLKPGDKVVSIGGIRGVIKSLKDDVVIVKVDDNTTLEFNKSAISSVVAPGKESKAGAKKADSAKKDS